MSLTSTPGSRGTLTAVTTSVVDLLVWSDAMVMSDTMTIDDAVTAVIGASAGTLNDGAGSSGALSSDTPTRGTLVAAVASPGVLV